MHITCRVEYDDNIQKNWLVLTDFLEIEWRSLSLGLILKYQKFKELFLSLCVFWISCRNEQFTRLIMFDYMVESWPCLSIVTCRYVLVLSAYGCGVPCSFSPFTLLFLLPTPDCSLRIQFKQIFFFFKYMHGDVRYKYCRATHSMKWEWVTLGRCEVRT